MFSAANRSTTCPVCADSEVELLFRRPHIPVMQNVVYSTRDQALAAQTGPFSFAECKRCGFAFNAEFDERLVSYDVDYDNDAPSPTVLSHYDNIAEMLIAKAGLFGGSVYEVGCGKGKFLEVLCAKTQTVRAVGIDPSCTPRLDGRLELRQARFTGAEFEPSARLIILRHVLEHIGNPVAFLRELRAACPPDARLYIEVPDLTWTLETSAFWDFCYEHCNYFTPASLRTALGAAGFSVIEAQGTTFGGQHQWALCRPGGRDVVAKTPDTAAGAYSRREKAEVDRYQAIALEPPCIVWGMATKGVMLNALVSGMAGGVDINRKKQGKFVAVSGVEIHPPAWLKSIRGNKTILVMNPGYEKEIREQVLELGVTARVLTV